MLGILVTYIYSNLISIYDMQTKPAPMQVSMHMCCKSVGLEGHAMLPALVLRELSSAAVVCKWYCVQIITI
jgi:hypothetical protein